MTRRSRARQVAFQVLYQDDLNPTSDPAEDDALLERRLRLPELVEFARELVAGVRRHREELDQAIGQTAANWSVQRMPATDRNVLRLGAYEILHSDTPDRVAIDEAIELAKRFGTAQSAAFVNGILDRLMHATPASESDISAARTTPKFWLFQVMYDWHPECWQRMVNAGVAAQDCPPDSVEEAPNVSDLSQMARGDMIVAALRNHRFAGYGVLTSDFCRGGPSLGIPHRRTGEPLHFSERFQCDWSVIPFDRDPPYIDCCHLKDRGYDIDLSPGRCVKRIDRETFEALKEALDGARVSKPAVEEDTRRIGRVRADTHEVTNRGGAESRREDLLTGEIIAAAIEVHRELGPGLLESAYEQSLCHELSLRGISFRRQVELPVEYKGIRLDCGYKMDIVVEDLVIVELKTVEKLLPVHEAQLLAYLKAYGRSVGLLINFNVPLLKDGIKRMVLNY